MKKRNLIGFTLLLSFLLLVFLYFWEVLAQSNLMVERDLPIFFLPNLKLWVEAVKGGQFPLWNPYSFCGQPLFATLQTAILYPPNLLLLILPLGAAFNLTIILHFILSGWFVYLLCREWGGSRTAGTLAAVAFTFGGFLLSIHNVLNTLQSATWTPLILFFLIRSQRTFGWKYPLLCSLTVLIQFLGGGIEVFFISQALVVLLTLIPGLWASTPNIVPWKTRFLRLGMIYSLFFGLGAVQILPFWEMTRNSVRYQGFSFQQATQWSLSWRDLVYVFLPDFFWRGAEFYLIDQNYLKSIYLGIIPFLMILSYFRYWPGRKAWTLVILAFPLLLALGKNTPLYQALFNFVPGFPTVRYPAKFFFLTNLFICLLTGLGWDALRKQLQTKPLNKEVLLKRVAMIPAFISALTLLGLYAFKVPLIRFLEKYFPISYAWPWVLNLHNLERFFFFALLTFLFLVFLADRKVSVKTGGVVLVCLLTADLFLANWGFYRRMESKAFFTASPNLAFVLTDLEQGRIFTSPLLIPIKTPQKKSFEELALSIFKEGFYFDYPLVHKIYNTLGFGILTYTPYQDLLNVFWERRVKPEDTPLLRLMNGKFILWHEAIRDSGFKLIRPGETYEIIPAVEGKTALGHAPFYRQVTAHLYENKTALPRAFLVPTFQVVKKGKERISLLTRKGFDPAQTVLLEEDPQAPVSTGYRIPLGEEVRIVNRSLNRLEIIAACTEPRFLFLSETFYPGWKVWVDGKLQKIYQANHAFRAVALAAGQHSIVFLYRPFTFYCGLAISGLTFLILVGWIVGAFYHRKGKNSEKRRSIV
ncbi:MAG: YfhO family protein [Thermodesulfobacteriota bacterium]